MLWLHARKERNAGWVDVGWSFSLVVLVAWYGVWMDGIPWRRLFIVGLVGFWGIRLGSHILSRLRKERTEDPRYAFLRRHWGLSADGKFFFFFQGQGVANIFLSAPLLVLMANPRPGFTAWDLLGATICVLAIVGERLADRQLEEWKANPANNGKTCRKGLWALSRHPNYFFEWVYWTGYPAMGLSLMGTSLALALPLTFAGPVVMYWLLNQVTGIPWTEKRALSSRGEDYRRYQEEVPKFFPRIQF